MAVGSFRGLGWFLGCAIVAPTCYMVNSHGAAEQARLKAIRSAIVDAHKDIRGLETEFQTRANLAQLEQWNGDVLAMAAPAPQQYLPDEAALATLDQAGQPELAALVVPAGAPVVTAPVATAATAPAATTVAAAAPADTTRPGASKPAAKAVAQQGRDVSVLMARANKRVAMVDDGLLSTSTMDDLQKLARREKLGLR